MQRALPPTSAPLRAALTGLRGASVAVFVFSAAINLLSLTGSIFMLEVYDRVIPTRSLPTLMALGVITAAMFGFLIGFDIIRARILTRVALAFSAKLQRRVFEVMVGAPLSPAALPDPLLPQRDLDQIRSFIASGGPAAFCDLPWLPFYLAICFFCHPVIGGLATLGSLALVATVVANERAMRRPMADVSRQTSARTALAESSVRGAEVLQSMGMGERFFARWGAIDAAFLGDQKQLLDTTATHGAISRVLRQALQSLMLGAGAMLVISGDATGGVMLASSIMTARALAPIDQTIAHWKNFTAARQSWRRLAALLHRHPERTAPMALPAPRQSLCVEGLALAPPGAQRVTLHDVRFSIQAGSAVGVIGPSASGKSSLTRALVGLWTPLRGAVRLDGADLERWPTSELGRHIGYVPQDIELFDGSVAENIARFDPHMTGETVLAAARAAGVHEMILRLPDGYETEIGDAGHRLSAGQRQRIALARALYGDPFLVVLDEPNSNLDQEGDDALVSAIRGLRARGACVILVAHRPSVLACLDHILVLRDGRQVDFGPRDEILSRLMPMAAPASTVPGLARRASIQGAAS